MANYLDDNGLLYLWGKLKSFFLTAVSYDTTNKKITVTKNGTSSDVVSASDIVTDGGGIKDVSNKADKATTLAGYGITDAYTKNEVDAKVASVYKPAGSAASVAALGSLTAGNEGKVYNMTEPFTTTSDFVEGSGKSYGAGTNVAIINIAASGEPAVYKYDILSGFVDLSGYLRTTDVVAITNAEIDEICS